MKQERKLISLTDNQVISMVIPAYKAEASIEKTLLKVKEVLDQVPYSYEIICVVDGSFDKTKEKADKFAKKFPDRVFVTGYKINYGKGHAVRYGMAQAKGDLIGFIDAGLDVDPLSIPMLLEHMKWYNADIIVGSKRHAASKVIYPWQRRIMSFGYQMGVRILFGLKVRDTQVGLKLFKRSVLEKVLPRLLIKQWAFDVEMLSVAYYLGFKRIYDAPIELHMDFSGFSMASKGFLNSIFRSAWDTAAVFYRLRILHYYDTRNKKRWITPHYLTFSKNRKAMISLE